MKISSLAAWIFPAAILALAMAIQNRVAINHDVAWLLIAAGRMLDGGNYIDDFFEMNMPLAILVYAPAQLLARTTGVALTKACLMWTFALAAQAGVLATRIPVISGTIPMRRAPLWAGWVVLTCCLIPGYDFSQKEHLVLLLSLPLLLCMGAGPAPISPAIRVYAAVLGAIGCFLKPHFAALPFLLLGITALREKSWRPLRSIEMLTLLGVGLANTALVVFRFPDWFVCARWASDLYGAYQRLAWESLFMLPWMPAMVICFAVVLLFVLRVPDSRRGAVPLLVGASYAFVVYLLQMKGWSYQFLPAVMFTVIAFGLLLFGHAETALRAVSWRWSVLAMTAIAFIGFGLTRTVSRLPPEATLKNSTLAEALSPAMPGDYVYAFTTTVVPVFPTVLLLDLNWSSRYSALWPLAGVARAESAGVPDPAIAAYRATLVRSVVADFERHPPQVVLVDRRSGQFGLPPRYDVLRDFATDPAFSKIWSAYESVGVGADFEIFVKL